jgi:hypothetical protein
LGDDVQIDTKIERREKRCEQKRVREREATIAERAR